MKEPWFKGERAFLPVESRGKQPPLEVGAYRTHLPPKEGQLKKKKVTFSEIKGKTWDVQKLL